MARRFAEGFAAEGFEVWWDATLQSGDAYDEVTETALNEAKAVVVLWSPRSAGSRWVRAEATVADRNGTLAPCMIEPCRRPVMFELTQTADLAGWDGDPADKAWKAYVADVRRLIGRKVPQGQGGTAPVAAAPVSARGRPGLAIEPFQCSSANEEFARDLADEAATIFSRYRYIVNFQPQAAGARYLLQGTLRHSGARVRLTARLIEAQTSEQIWADRIEAEGDDPFALQEDIANKLASMVALAIELAERRWALARPEEALGAYYGMIAGLHAFRTFSVESHRHALEIIDVALMREREDPYLLASASACCAALHLLSPAAADRNKLRNAGRDYSRRALLTGEDDPYVLAYLAWAGIQFGDDIAILDAMAERTLARNPGWSSGWGMSGQVKLAKGELALAIQRFERALELEPRAQDRWGIFNMLGCALVLAGQYEAALVPLKEALQLVPGAPYITLGMVAAYVHLGRLEEARELRRRLAPNDEDVDLDLLRHPAHRAFFRDALGRLASD